MRRGVRGGGEVDDLDAEGGSKKGVAVSGVEAI
jgi:hypothetical protein